MRRLILAFVALIATPFAALAERVHLAGGDVLDVRGGQILSNQDVLVEDDVIVAIGAADTLGLDGSERTINMAGMTLLPGLSDSHVHLTSMADIHGYRRLSISLPRSAVFGVVNAERTLLAGFTTVRNLGAPGFADVALRDSIEDGDIPGPRIIPAGRSIGITGGHCDNNLLPYGYGVTSGGVADGPWAVREKVRENVKFGAGVIKFCGTGGVLSAGTQLNAQQFSLEEMKAIVDEADLLGVRVAVHAHGTRGITSALEAGVHSIEHASFIDDAGIATAIDKGTFLSMDIYVSDYILSEGEAAGILEESLAKERLVGRRQRERFQAAVEAGAKIAFGSDAGVYDHGLNGRQFAYMVEWGMAPIDAIRASTIGNAELFGLSDQIGEITPGKQADIIAVDGDPLENVRELESVDFVMKAGTVYRMPAQTRAIP